MQVLRLLKFIRAEQGRFEWRSVSLPRSSGIAQQESEAAHEEERRTGTKTQRSDCHQQSYTPNTAGQANRHSASGNIRLDNDIIVNERFSWAN